MLIDKTIINKRKVKTILKILPKIKSIVILTVIAYVCVHYKTIINYISNYFIKNYDYEGLLNKSNQFNNKLFDVKYILLWTSSKHVPFNFLEKGQKVFVKRNCSFTNCYVTDNRNYLGHYSEFEVILFHGPELSSLRLLPLKRSRRQKYVFASTESAHNYPLYNDIWNNYFNWTWTYKLNSDALWNYIIVRNSKYEVVGPVASMTWPSLEDMNPIDDTLKNILNKKTKAAAWFVSNCDTKSDREGFAKKINVYLQKYDLVLDIYGECGTLKCPKYKMSKCLNLLKRDYYFYFAFENSLSEDYVTEKILHGLNHYTVPIVYGGANYSRFMPKHIYLNAKELGPEKLAITMKKIIQNRTRYYDFFRWRKYYSFHGKSESVETDDYCNFCKLINNKIMLRKFSVYKNFTGWWMSNSSFM